MKRLVIFALLGAAGFFGWQYWLSRRKNAGLSAYYKATKESLQANAEASNVLQRVVPALAAINWDVRGWYLQKDDATPRVLADGSWGTPATTADVKQPTMPWLFGFGSN
jgi:hypothetical protein